MSDENLTQLLAKRAPKPRSKSTTALIWLLILLIGVLLGGAIGKGAASAPSAPPGVAQVRGTVSDAGDGRVTIATKDAAALAPGDAVVVQKAP